MAQVHRTGAVVRSPSGYPMINPHLSVANQAYGQLRAMIAEFGMSPASRSRVAAVPEEPEDPAAHCFADRPATAGGR
jgi:P27 family predicted phage terminase small subunit